MMATLQSSPHTFACHALMARIARSAPKFRDNQLTAPASTMYRTASFQVLDTTDTRPTVTNMSSPVHCGVVNPSHIRSAAAVQNTMAERYLLTHRALSAERSSSRTCPISIKTRLVFPIKSFPYSPVSMINMIDSELEG